MMGAFFCLCVCVWSVCFLVLVLSYYFVYLLFSVCPFCYLFISLCVLPACERFLCRCAHNVYSHKVFRVNNITLLSTYNCWNCVHFIRIHNCKSIAKLEFCEPVFRMYWFWVLYFISFGLPLCVWHVHMYIFVCLLFCSTFVCFLNELTCINNRVTCGIIFNVPLILIKRHSYIYI